VKPIAGSPVAGAPGAQASPPPGLAYNAPPFQQPPPFAQPPGYPGQFPPAPMQFPGQQPPFQPPPFQGSPPFNQGPYQPPPVPGANGHHAPAGVPGSSNLPQRPAFNAPPVNAAQFQQLHHGAPGSNGKAPEASASVEPTSTPAPEGATEKKGKKDSKNVRLIYGDNEISPEEKMAQLPKYAFSPDRSPATVA
jgi:hypothetical protein